MRSTVVPIDGMLSFLGTEKPHCRRIILRGVEGMARQSAVRDEFPTRIPP